MTSPVANEQGYLSWQNRAYRFYVAARLLHRNELYSPAVYSASIAIELLLKATLIYWDRSFDEFDAGHGIAKLARMVRNKTPDAKNFAVPTYLYYEQRYLNLSRYPAKGKGVGIPASFIDDLDKVFADLIMLVPFQHNTELKRVLSGSHPAALTALRHNNRQMRRLRNFLRGRAK